MFFAGNKVKVCLADREPAPKGLKFQPSRHKADQCLCIILLDEVGRRKLIDAVAGTYPTAVVNVSEFQTPDW